MQYSMRSEILTTVKFSRMWCQVVLRQTSMFQRYLLILYADSRLLCNNDTYLTKLNTVVM